MPRSIRDILNEGNPNKTGPALQVGKIGTAMAGSPQFRRATLTTNVLILPELARAAAIVSAYVTAGATPGAKTPVLAAPAAGQVGINGVGNIAFFAGEGTAAEVTYIAEEGPVIEEVVPVAANVGTLLQGRAARILLSADALVGTTLGPKAIQLRAGAVAAAQASLNAAGTGVTFAGADAVTSARIRYIATPGVGPTPADPVADITVADKNF
jgi:hypothetical protein